MSNRNYINRNRYYIFSMFFFFAQVFALENPEVNMLSYAPGPVDTDMFTLAREKIADSKTKKLLNEMKEKKTVLTTEQTVNRLVQVLKERKYNSADHVDYYDEERKNSPTGHVDHYDDL